MKNHIVQKEIVALVVTLFSVGSISSLSFAALPGPGTEDCLPAALSLSTGTSCGETSTPTLRLLAQRSTVNTYGTGYVYDMQLVGDRLYMGNIYYDPVFDVSNPSNPMKLYEIPHDYGAHRAIKVTDGKYYAVGYALEVWDAVTFTYLGGKVGMSSLTSEATDLDVVNNMAYIVNDVGNLPAAQRGAVLHIYDMTNPSNITQLASLFWSEYSSGPGDPNPTNVIVEGSTAYIGMEGLRTYNVSNPTNPTFVNRFDARSYTPNAQLHKRDDAVKVGPWIYKAHAQLGILALYTYPPGHTVLGGLIGSPAISLRDLIALEVVGDRAFVATAQDKKLKVLDITDVRNPRVLASTSISALFDATAGTETLEIEVDSTRKLAFVAGEVALNVYDVSDFLP